MVSEFSKFVDSKEMERNRPTLWQKLRNLVYWKVIFKKNKKKTRLPIITAVYAVLYEGKSAKKEFKKLTEKLD